MITVVIPYFQREPGILRKALRSIAAQEECPLPVHVIVVDDESPIPARAEVAATGPLPMPVQVLTQKNGGPASARNAGLNNVPESTRYLAFLDSDDEWSPNHLARAVCALEAGFDFFFGDLLQLDQTVGAFARAGRIRPAEHPTLARSSNLHAYQGDMLDQIIRGNVIGTSTVVYDFDRFADQRFRIEFTSAGEDYLFWMALAHRGARIAFSSAVEATYGRGVNVYAGSGWGTDGHLLRVHNELRFKKMIGSLFEVSADQRTHIDTSIHALRVAFARDLLHRLRHRKSVPLGLLATHWALDPLSFLMLPVTAVRLLTQRA